MRMHNVGVSRRADREAVAGRRAWGKRGGEGAEVDTMTSTERRNNVRREWSAKRVRAYLGGELVADTTKPMLVWETPHYPTYYVPTDDVRAKLVPTGRTEQVEHLGEAELLDVVIGNATAEGAARRYGESPVRELHDLVRLEWKAMDQWFEEDEPVFAGPRDPYHRVDILGSSRHVKVVVDGVTVAESRQPRILFETHLPPRYYMPLTDVRLDLLRPSDTQTVCPYKGTASYWCIEVNGTTHEDLVWTYRTPLPESQKVAGLAAFYNERVDLYVDGELRERPHRG
jgi:uncharacterized protein (DUF427 family)